MNDSISRKAAIRWVKTECNPYGKPTLDFESGKKVIEHLEQMPSTDRPRGEWLARDCVFGVVYCSECGYELRKNDTNYCPNCGADMRGDSE